MIRFTSCFLLVCQIIFFCSPRRTDQNIYYLGYQTPGDSALLFAPGIISTDSFEHSAPAFSYDGKTVLWSIVEMPSWKASIFEMNYENGKWTTPHRPAFCDTAASDIYPSFSADGSVVYFSSSRRLPSGQSPSKGNVIWRVEKKGDEWTIPSPLDSVVSSGGDYSPSVANNDNLYFTHGPFGSPNWDILMSDSDMGSHVRPKPLPSSVNTSGYEDGPFIAPDESYIIFESDRPGGMGESVDLYISFRLENGEWSNAINMGPTINSNDNERFARVSPDGKFLFFGSNRRRVNGQPNFDIYWIDSVIINTLKARGK